VLEREGCIASVTLLLLLLLLLHIYSKYIYNNNNNNTIEKGEKMKVTTTISIDSKLKEKAKRQGINVSEATEEALLLKLDDPGLIRQMEDKRKALLAEARRYKHKIDELKETQRKKEEVLGTKEERLERALKTVLKVVDNEGTIDDDRIGFIASHNDLLFDDLMTAYKLHTHQKEG